MSEPVEIQVKEGRVLRVGVGTAEKPFGTPWRFWTSSDSAYFSLRSMGSTFKASFHPADATHDSAVWTFAFTRESTMRLRSSGRRRSHTWQQQPEFQPGWYQGPAIFIPRLPDRRYDLPYAGDLSGVTWVDAPAVGNTRVLSTLLTDARPDLPPLEVSEGQAVIAVLLMSNGWQLVVGTSEHPLADPELAYAKEVHDKAQFGVSGGVHGPRSTIHGDVLAISPSREGRPLLMHVVLDSDNIYDDKARRA